MSTDAAYRRMADQFFRETGLQAPGESDPLRIGPARPEGSVLARWAIWLGQKRAEQVGELAEVCKLLDSIDCCTGYSIPDDDYPKFWEALELARTIIAKAAPAADPGGEAAR